MRANNRNVWWLMALLCLLSSFCWPTGVDAAPKKRVRTQHRRFRECCMQIGMKQLFIDRYCHYPPEALFGKHRDEIIVFHFREYLGCYARQQDNRECCADALVPEECLELCNGEFANQFPDADPCDKPSTRRAISTCNMGPEDD